MTPQLMTPHHTGCTITLVAGFSGADISNLVNEAALTAAKEGADTIAPHMLDQAFDKIRMGVERK